VRKKQTVVKLLQILTSCKEPDEETARERMVSYVAGSCSRLARAGFEIHCLTCAECSFKLTVVLGLLRPPADGEEEKALAPFLKLGLEAARKARLMARGEGTTRKEDFRHA
jgi:hypothetical protein